MNGSDEKSHGSVLQRWFYPWHFQRLLMAENF